jgi:hypothetical protein
VISIIKKESATKKVRVLTLLGTKNYYFRVFPEKRVKYEYILKDLAKSKKTFK